MCYPCNNCGKCGQEKVIPSIRCPKCKTVLTEEHPSCETCGWSLPLPPGAKAPAMIDDLDHRRGKYNVSSRSH